MSNLRKEVPPIHHTKTKKMGLGFRGGLQIYFSSPKRGLKLVRNLKNDRDTTAIHGAPTFQLHQPTSNVAQSYTAMFELLMLMLMLMLTFYLILMTCSNRFY